MTIVFHMERPNPVAEIHVDPVRADHVVNPVHSTATAYVSRGTL